jgi:mono/diheme cytochrome c family protein
MNSRTRLVSLLALLIFVTALPIYAAREPLRMAWAQNKLEAQSLEEAARIYVKYCATCHGDAGQGLGAMPSLNYMALAGADYDSLFQTIARAAHGTTMAAWHVGEGGVLNDYQIGQLVLLIQNGNWTAVRLVALDSGFIEPILPTAEENGAYMLTEDDSDPHRCVACHEDPKIHKDKFGLNCARCHSSVAWTPALLTKHIFALDHGDQGAIDCTVCHVNNYYTFDCYACHDHTREQMAEVHTSESINEYEACIDCHPTGVENEARDMMNKGLLQGKIDAPNISSSVSIPELPIVSNK